MLRWLTILVCLSLPVTGLAAPRAARVETLDAYVPEPPLGQTNAVLYMTLKNDEDAALQLVGVVCSFATHCDLHTHVHKDGRMAMQRVPSLELPAHSQTALRPGGLHMMLVGLKAPLRKGQQVELTLRYADGQSSMLSAVVRDLRR